MPRTTFVPVYREIIDERRDAMMVGQASRMHRTDADNDADSAAGVVQRDTRRILDGKTAPSASTVYEADSNSIKLGVCNCTRSPMPIQLN